MGTELRKDYILDRYCIIAADRGKRPHEFARNNTLQLPKVDFFGPGNEHLTPPEIGRIDDGHGGWNVRWFPNKFSAVDAQGQVELRTDNEFFTYANAVGHHEVIVERPEIDQEIETLSDERLVDVLKVFSRRIDEVSMMDSVKYAMLFKNHGADAGTSIMHSHSQLIGYNIIPSEIKEKLKGCKKYDVCPYCKVWNIEKNSDRRCYENGTFVAFTPYASRYAFELWIMPKRHIRVMSELTDTEHYDLARILKASLGKLSELNASYNLLVQHAPIGENLHLHFEITPRIGRWAGFELGTGTIINAVSPERAAKFYRGEE